MAGRTLLLLGTGVAILGASLFLLLPGEERRYSVLLITLDTTRADHLSCYGDSRSHTPRLDALAKRGVLFEHAEASAPITLPSHASILTGLFPPDHGVRDNGFFRLDDRVPTITERFRDAGYRTAAFVSAVILDGKYGLDRGFEVYGDEFDEPLDAKTRFPTSRRARETVSKALGWLNLVGEDEPFFLWTHFYDAHAPYDPPSPWDAAYVGSPYAGEIAYLDRQLAPLLDRVGEMRGEDLLVVVVGDHGESLGEHGEATHGFFVYESTVRVPLIIAGGPFGGGAKISEPVRTVDIAPTLLALAGLDPLPGVRGTRLGRVRDGEARDLLCYSEAWIPRGYGWSGLRALRRGRHKVIEGSHASILDLEVDPKEEDEKPGPRAGRMARMLLDLEKIDLAGGPAALAELSEADINALVGLGYLNATGGTPAAAATVVDAERADPRDRVEHYRTLQRVKSMVADGEFEMAAEAMTRLLAEDPGNPHVRLQRATILRRTGNLQAALVDLEFAAENLPGDARPPTAIGNIHRSAGRLDDAEAAFREALRRSPGHYLAAFQLGSVQLAREDLAAAAETYGGILDRHPRDARSMNNLACALIRGDLDREEGFRMLRRAVDTSPRDGEIRQSLGDALLNDDRAEEALPHLLTAREILGNRPELERLIDRARKLLE